MIKSVKFSSTNSMHIQKFNINSLSKNSICNIIGKKNSGKTTLVKSILNYHNDIKNGIVISPTEKTSIPKEYTNFCSNLNTYYAIEQNIIDELLIKQEQLKENIIDNNSYIVLDECLTSKEQIYNCASTRELLFNSKQYNLMVLLTMQFPLCIIPELCNNFDYIFLAAEDIISNKQILYNNYCNIFPNYETFNIIFTELTRDNGFMVIKNNCNNLPLTEKIFWYKVDLEQLNTTNIISNTKLLNFSSTNFPNNTQLEHDKDIKLHTTLQTNIDNISNDIKDITNDIEDISNDIEDISNDISILKDKINNNNTKLYVYIFLLFIISEFIKAKLF